MLVFEDVNTRRSGRRSQGRVLDAGFCLLTAYLLTAITACSVGGAPPTRTATATQTATAPRPNVVIILADDQNAGTLDGMPRLRSHIANHGTTFEQAFVTNPLCCPARATLLTGNHSHTNTVYTNGGAYGGMSAFEESGASRHTLATYLDGIGYQTAIFGKYMNAITRYPRRYVPPGWDYWEVFREDNAEYYDYDLAMKPCWQQWCPSERLQIEHHGTAVADYSTDVLGEDALAWLRNERDTDEPFFLYFTPYSPHGPALASRAYGDKQRFLDQPPLASPAFNETDVSDKPTYIRTLPPLKEKETRQAQAFRIKQYRSAYSLDRWVGRIAEELEPTREMRDTLFIYTSDNGHAWGEHRWRYKLVPYERSIRVPLVIRYDPLGDEAHVDSRNMVLNIDILPTILDIVGVSPTHEVEGRSLVDILSGGTLGRQAFLIENLHYDRGGRDTVPTYCALRTALWKYVVYSPASEQPGLVTGPYEEELYYLPDDPYELRNLARTKPLVADKLRPKLRSLCTPEPPGWRVNWGSM